MGNTNTDDGLEPRDALWNLAVELLELAESDRDLGSELPGILARLNALARVPEAAA